MGEDPVAILFVCTGNICRSPTAEGVFLHLAGREGLSSRLRVDSAGMIDFHCGDPPDRRARRAARRRGYDLDPLRARRLEPRDFERFDYLLAMDLGHRGEMTALCPPTLRPRIHLFLEFAPGAGVLEVPDPYGGGPDGFEYVLDLVEDGCRGLLEHLRSEHGWDRG